MQGVLGSRGYSVRHKMHDGGTALLKVWEPLHYGRGIVQKHWAKVENEKHSPDRVPLGKKGKVSVGQKGHTWGSPLRVASLYMSAALATSFW